MPTRKHRFSYEEKYAIWRAYDNRCFYCNETLRFLEVTIDHIVPEYLGDNASEIQDLRIHIPGFLINDYCNRVPAHGGNCNYRKGASILPAPFMTLCLTEVQKKLPRVREELSKLSIAKKQDKILGDLLTGLEAKIITESDVIKLLMQSERARTINEPLVISLGLIVEDALAIKGIKARTPMAYYEICDYLEDDLEENLRNLTTYSFHYTESSSRNGESLSVRLCFPELPIEDSAELSLPEIESPMPSMMWWRLMEITNFYRIYGKLYREVYGQ